MFWILMFALGLVAGLVFTFNKLVRFRNQSRNAWADIDVQLKRRYDLIPNLVETVKGYAGHEKETFEAVVEARNRAMAAQGPAQKGPGQKASWVRHWVHSLPWPSPTLSFVPWTTFYNCRGLSVRSRRSFKMPAAITTLWSGTGTRPSSNFPPIW